MQPASEDNYVFSKAMWRKTAVILTVFMTMIYVSAIAMAHASPQQLIRGTVLAVSNDVLTVKSDMGGIVQVQVTPATEIQNLPVESTDLKGAATATFSDISVGDRILISANITDSGTAVARIAYLMKAGDIEQKNVAEQLAWKKNGVGGLVHSINPAANTVTISVVSAAGTTNVIIQATDKTQLMRYAPDSVRFADAKPGSLAQIQVGDQLNARGERNPDGAAVTADKIITGSFRNISGQVIGIDVPNDTLTVKDLATKAIVTIALTTNTDMHKLTPAVAAKFAARLKGGREATPAAGQGSGQDDGGRSSSSDLTQIISSMPAVTLAQLKPGDALIIAATASTKPNSVTAIMLLSGVEPILTAAPVDSSMVLAPWSLSSGAASQ